MVLNNNEKALTRQETSEKLPSSELAYSRHHRPKSPHLLAKEREVNIFRLFLASKTRHYHELSKTIPSILCILIKKIFKRFTFNFTRIILLLKS